MMRIAKMKRIFGLVICSLLAFSPIAQAQSTWPTPQTPTGGPTVTGGAALGAIGQDRHIVNLDKLARFRVDNSQRAVVAYVRT
jgi:hypothetical protein